MSINLKILIVALIIACLGILSIYSSNYRKEGDFWQSLYQKQIVWVLIGLIVFQLLSNFHYHRIWDWTYFLYAFTIALLFLVFMLGITRLGAQRWLKFSWFNFQPSELAKLVLVIFLAKYFSAKSADDVSLKASKFGIWRALLFPLFFVALPVGLIAEQPDLGSSVIIFCIFFAMLYMSNVKLRFIIIFVAVILLLLPVSWHFLRDYQKERILVFLNPNIDPLGAGYTVVQSKIAIGSGGFFGKGWLAGTQSQLHFLPEAHTDFIFATFTEEWGLLGGIILIYLYYLLIKQGIEIATNTSDYFGRLLSLGISLMLCIQIAINIAMNMGLAPVVGLPLPLLSYGGSSVIATFAALGILVNISKTRAVF